MARITILNNSRDAIDVPAGTVIFQQGDRAEHMYVVIEGGVDLTIGNTTIATAGPGEAFGEMALIDNVARSATAVAAVGSRVVPIDRSRFLFMVTETPNFALQLLGIMAERLRTHNDRLVS
jgi:CRP/FNR family cyclic AMP-dependent transcriptional regulator